MALIVAALFFTVSGNLNSSVPRSVAAYAREISIYIAIAERHQAGYSVCLGACAGEYCRQAVLCISRESRPIIKSRKLNGTFSAARLRAALTGIVTEIAIINIILSAPGDLHLWHENK